MQTPPLLPRLRRRGPVPAAALAFLLAAACRPGEDGPDARAPCAVAVADTTGWSRVAAAGISLLVPPGYRPDPAEPRGGAAAAWLLRVEGRTEPAGRVVVQRGTAVPELGGTEDERAGLNDFHACRLDAGGATAEVASAWLEDPTSPGGRSWQTVARWPGTVEDGTVGVYLVADDAAEHGRLETVLATVRPR